MTKTLRIKVSTANVAIKGILKQIPKFQGRNVTVILADSSWTHTNYAGEGAEVYILAANPRAGVGATHLATPAARPIYGGRNHVWSIAPTSGDVVVESTTDHVVIFAARDGIVIVAKYGGSTHVQIVLPIGAVDAALLEVATDAAAQDPSKAGRAKLRAIADQAGARRDLLIALAEGRARDLERNARIAGDLADRTAEIEGECS